MAENIDIDPIRTDIERNRQQRLQFITWYANWVKRTPNSQWSRQQKEMIQRIKAISQIEGVGGIEIHYPTEIDEDNIDAIREVLKETGLKVVQFCPHLWVDPEWKYGAFTNPDPGIRKDAMDLAKRTVDISREFEPEVMVYWPAQDGYDYFFQVD